MIEINYKLKYFIGNNYKKLGPCWRLVFLQDAPVERALVPEQRQTFRLLPVQVSPKSEPQNWQRDVVNSFRKKVPQLHFVASAPCTSGCESNPRRLKSLPKQGVSLLCNTC
jgi:hypothetical protein